MRGSRLNRILGYIDNIQVLADIGTDHGYIPVRAVLENKTKRAIAADISKGSLEKAIEIVEKNNLKQVIDCRLGGGLDVLQKDEADIVVIAGMGGILISEILEHGHEQKFHRKNPYYILQPVQFPDRLRKYLQKKQFEIVEEDLVKEDGIIYHIIKTRKNTESAQIEFSDLELQFGRMNIEKKSSLLVEELARQIGINNQLLGQMVSENRESTIQRRIEIDEKISSLKELMKYVTS